MNININITKNDSEESAKIVLLDHENKILFLKRAKHLAKHAEDLDFPGGHLQENEDLLTGLKREVYEETSIKIKKAVFYKKVKKINFFWGKYDFQEINLSHEHEEFLFLGRAELDRTDKFQKIALEILEKIQDA